MSYCDLGLQPRSLIPNTSISGQRIGVAGERWAFEDLNRTLSRGICITFRVLELVRNQWNSRSKFWTRLRSWDYKKLISETILETKEARGRPGRNRFQKFESLVTVEGYSMRSIFNSQNRRSTKNIICIIEE